MPDVINTPLMGLPNPVPNNDPGPDYAENIQSCFNILDGHNHSAGSGNQISTDGIIINADLPINNFNLTLARSVRFTAQVAPISDPTDLGCLYESGVDLWYNDGNGNQVQLTSGGSVNATSSGISSPPASAAFVGSVLVVNQNTNTPGNIQAGSILIGNNTVSSNFVTVSAPTALGSNYNFVLPTGLPGAQKFMTLDSSGNTAAPWAVDNSTIEVSGGSTVQVKDIGIVTAKLADSSVTTAKIADLNVTRPKLAAVGQQVSSSCGNYSINTSSFTDITNISVSITTTGRPVILIFQPDTSASGTFGSGASVIGKTAANTNAVEIDLLFFRDSTKIAQVAALSLANASNIALGVGASYVIMDAPAASTYTYKIQARGSSGAGTLQIFNYLLAAYEL